MALALQTALSRAFIGAVEVFVSSDDKSITLGADFEPTIREALGRAVYVGGSGYEDVPDPGAWGLACFFLGLAGLRSEDEGWEAI